MPPQSCKTAGTTTLPDDALNNPPDGRLDPTKYYPDFNPGDTGEPKRPPTNTVASAWFKGPCSAAAYRLRDDGRIEVDDGTKMFTPELAAGAWCADVEKWRGLIQAAATRFKIPEALIAAVMNVESCGNPKAGSEKGAMGLMQLLVGTARWTSDPAFPKQTEGHPQPSLEQIFDPEWNITNGAKLLAYDVQLTHGNFAKALVYYNAGSVVCRTDGTCPDDPWKMKSECGYVSKVLASYNTAIEQRFSPSYAIRVTDTIEPIAAEPTGGTVGSLLLSILAGGVIGGVIAWGARGMTKGGVR